MDKQLDPAVQERIRALCRQITVAHNLDAEIQEELYGHMEDKLIAYLAGEEKLSDEDAFILVREHFGNPETLREILQTVHELDMTSSVRVSLSRRIMAALVATVALSLISRVVSELLQVSLVIRMMQSSRLDPYAISPFWLWTPVKIVATILFLGLLLKWAHQLRRRKKPWFVFFPMHWMWIATGFALLLYVLVPGVHLDFFRGQPPSYAVYFTLQIICGVAWLWWAHHPPRVHRGLERAFLVWVLLNTFLTLFPMLIPSVYASVDTFRTGGIEPLATGKVLGTGLNWAVLWHYRHMLELSGYRTVPVELLTSFVFSFSLALVSALPAWGIYFLFRRSRHEDGSQVAEIIDG